MCSDFKFAPQRSHRGGRAQGSAAYFTSLLDQFQSLTHRHTEIGNNRHHLILDSVVDPKG